MACIDRCPQGAIELMDNMEHCICVINETLCTNCGQCHDLCPENHPVKLSKPVLWLQGWALDEALRKRGTSGGAAGAIETAFIENGGYVCSCVFGEGAFKFAFTNKAEDVARFAGSKYAMSDATDVYKTTELLLRQQQKVLFLGLPCQVGGMRRYMRSLDESLLKNLYTIDLICHGTPSPKTLALFLSHHGTELSQTKEIAFRDGHKFRLCADGKTFAPAGMLDRYSIPFNRGMTYTDSCYACAYATDSRCSDLTLGDSWGTSLPDEELHQGISLFICQNEKGKELIEMANLHLEDVDAVNAIAHNSRLSHPGIAPESRPDFFAELKAGKPFDETVVKYYPGTFYDTSR